MTKQEILEKLKFDLELRNRSEDTIHDYSMHVRMYQDHFDKPADQMGVEEIKEFLHYQLTEKNNSPATVNTYNSALRFFSEKLWTLSSTSKRFHVLKATVKSPIFPQRKNWDTSSILRRI